MNSLYYIEQKITTKKYIFRIYLLHKYYSENICNKHTYGYGNYNQHFGAAAQIKKFSVQCKKHGKKQRQSHGIIGEIRMYIAP